MGKSVKVSEKSQVKKVNEIEEVEVNEVEEGTGVKRMGTGTLLRSKNPKERISGVIRVMGKIEIARSEASNQTVQNKVSKATLNIRTSEDIVKEELMDCWADIVRIHPELELIREDLKTDIIKDVKTGELRDKVEEDRPIISNDFKEVYDKLLMLGRVSAGEEVVNIDLNLDFDFDFDED